MNRTEADFDGFIQLLHCCGIEKSEPLYELAAIDRPDLPQLDRSFDGEPASVAGTTTSTGNGMDEIRAEVAATMVTDPCRFPILF